MQHFFGSCELCRAVFAAAIAIAAIAEIDCRLFNFLCRETKRCYSKATESIVKVSTHAVPCNISCTVLTKRANYSFLKEDNTISKSSERYIENDPKNLFSAHLILWGSLLSCKVCVCWFRSRAAVLYWKATMVVAKTFYSWNCRLFVSCPMWEPTQKSADEVFEKVVRDIL
jgi:hypothetical protein